VVSGFSRTSYVASGFSRTSYVASGFSRTSYVASGFSRTSVVAGFSRPSAWHLICLSSRVFPGRPEHLKTFDYLGPHRYFLTFCTFDRRRVFVTSDPVDTVRTQFLRAADDERFAFLAYCFMPDHVHLLVEGKSDDSECRRFFARAKQLSGFHYKKQFGEPLWQRYGFERTLRSDEATLSVARYILENPVRAGLVKCVEEYPFLGSDVYTTAEILEAVQVNGGWRDRSG
jgi:putative transposase